MTTINNLTIEQMREIVEGAPDWAKAYNTKMKQYTNGFIRCSSDVYFDDLRTAISEHDSREFKVGDLVVLNPFAGDFAKMNDALYDLFAFENDLETLAVLSDRKGGEVRSSIEHLRHVTREEFKAGHRLEAERHG